MSADGEAGAVVAVLLRTVSEDARERAEAERALDGLAARQAFLPFLLRLSVMHTEPAVRQLSAITFKNLVRTRWGDIAAQDGDDVLDAGDGANKLYGNRGDDTLSSGSGDDYLKGDLGNDTISAGAGNDRIYGDLGNDTISAGDGEDFIKAGTGDDIVFGGAGADRVYGERGADQIDGGAGDDYIDASSDDDVIAGGEGADYIKGGSGSDIFVFRTVAEAGDTIADFSLRYGDMLDVSGLLDGTGHTVASAISSGVFALTEAGRRDSWFEFDADGEGGADAVQVAYLRIFAADTELSESWIL